MKVSEALKYYLSNKQPLKFHIIKEMVIENNFNPLTTEEIEMLFNKFKEDIEIKLQEAKSDLELLRVELAIKDIRIYLNSGDLWDFGSFINYESSRSLQDLAYICIMYIDEILNNNSSPKNVLVINDNNVPKESITQLQQSEVVRLIDLLRNEGFIHKHDNKNLAFIFSYLTGFKRKTLNNSLSGKALKDLREDKKIKELLLSKLESMKNRLKREN